MDGLALRAANELVCNGWDAAGVEIGPGAFIANADNACVIAVTGCGVELVVNECSMPLWSAIYVRRAWPIEVVRRDWGWAYLAVAGGVDVPLVLRSRSTYVRGSFGGFQGRALLAGDAIPIGQSQFGAEIAGRTMLPQHDLSTDNVIADVVLGPQLDRFTEAGLHTFLSSEYTITTESDRMGYRLQGTAITHTSGADVVSDGSVLGALQVPENGQPILLMSDHATTGGYTKIGTVTTLDTWRIAQCTPGRGKVRFRVISVGAAQQKYRDVLGGLRMLVRDLRDESWYSQ
jgi:antagonist of KipI